jgi:hypothetical protein
VDFGIPNIVCHLADVALAKLRSTAENRFNASNPDLSYEMLQNPAGFVLVPTKRAQATVQLAATSRTVLDEQISVPIAARSPFDHLSIILAPSPQRLVRD